MFAGRRAGMRQDECGERRRRGADDVFGVAAHIVGNCLALLQKKDMRELTQELRARSAEEVQAAVEYIRTLDPRPGQRYNWRDAADRAGRGVREARRWLRGADERRGYAHAAVEPGATARCCGRSRRRRKSGST